METFLFFVVEVFDGVFVCCFARDVVLDAELVRFDAELRAFELEDVERPFDARELPERLPPPPNNVAKNPFFAIVKPFV